MELIKQQANWAKLRSKVFETPRLVQPFDKHRGIRVLPHITRYQKRSAEVHLYYSRSIISQDHRSTS